MFNLFKKDKIKFEKVSFNQFITGFKNNDITNFNDNKSTLSIECIDKLQEMYRNIILPTRATKHSAGYDMYLPFDVELRKGESIIIPTGIRAKMVKKTVLFALPKSGLGYKFRLSLANTVGVIDADYYYSDNEGHIFMKIVFDDIDVFRFDISKISDAKSVPVIRFEHTLEDSTLKLKAGSKFCQLIFVPFKICSSDSLNKGVARNGGFGSTGI